ncbi:MAG: DUF2066 domain-containing protein [Gammaproteobacteria bacterium]|nr:DUF2066 domain-containing protein [Gammaproteobacteria bacterium]
MASFICLMAAGSAWGEVVPWLYEAQVKVESQTDPERRRAAGLALAEVLTRITGMREIPVSRRIDRAFADPERFYVRYAFATREALDPEVAEAETHFEVRFEPDALLYLLREAGLPIWSADRPTVLVWAVVDEAGRRDIVAATSAGQIGDVAAAFGAVARRRGVKVSLPLMDLEDHRVSPLDLRGGFWRTVVDVSRRYAPDLLVVGRIVATGTDRWSSHWELRPAVDFEGPAAVFQHDATSAAEAAGEAVHRLADALAERFAVRGGDLDAVRVTVRGVRTVGAYASLLDHLQSREYIDRVEVNSVESGAVLLRLHSRSTREQLQELLLMGGSLLAADSGGRVPGFERPVPSGMLDLKWTGAR